MALLADFASLFMNLSDAEVSRLVRVCDEENPSSQDMMLLAYCYENGDHVPLDEARAVEWYRRSAESGDLIAMETLGSCYLAGTGVPKNPSLAVTWLKRSAKLGNTRAMCGLARYYDDGIHEERDGELAIQWYRQTLDHGCFLYWDDFASLLDRERGPLGTLRYFVDAYKSCESSEGKGEYKALIRELLSDTHGFDVLLDWQRSSKGRENWCPRSRPCAPRTSE